MNYKAIIFSRVSSTHQDIVQQTNELKNEVRKSGYKDDEILMIEQKESAIKLSEEERIGIQQLKDAISHYNIECVFVYEISRISRQPAMLYNIRDLFISKKIQLICMRPYMRLLEEDGTMSQSANIMFSLFSAMSESEMMLKKERMRRGANYAKMQGRHSGGHVMYGYLTDKNHRYMINKREAEVVKRIFTEYTYNNKSMRKLAKELQEEGHFKNSSYLTCVQQIYNILHRDCYCGRRNGMPQIITEELFERSVQKRKQSIIPRTNDTENMSMCKGLIFDAKSGLLLSSNTCTGMYYSKRCKGAAVTMAIIDEIIWDEVIKLHKKYTVLDKEKIVMDLGGKLTATMNKLANMHNKLRGLKSVQDRIEERYILGKLSEQKRDELEEKNEINKKQIKARIEQLSKEFEDTERKYKNIYESENIIIDYNTLDKRQRYNITHDVISKIIIGRLSRSVLEISIHNKYNTNIKVMRYDTFKHKHIK